ncbi:hypothetical protein SAMN02745126_06482 [Enhydrobacter aerosaccus]|uniref:Uncharacterized protein n=1 Tax=Enhydrobacter aerosaccus TaxID=225324 RepID=A0A1T4TLF1_9HYPH|nr:DUF6527 family protein [Enhydrobacter aerosaccus]SKA41286.1 hypothetical protein SAMN02745126_06482 [Enhydrobacter aerosaccus]
MTIASRFSRTCATLRHSAVDLLRRSFVWSGLIEPVQLKARLSPEYPDLKTLPEETVYVVGGADYQKWAYMVCPCGCGERIMLSLAKNRRPRWQVEIDWLGRPTIKPSVWQTDGCYSHFWIKKGAIQWTRDTGTPYRVCVAKEA